MLAGVMAGAVVTHLFIVGGSPLMAIILLVVTGIIAWGRRQRTMTLLAGHVMIKIAIIIGSTRPGRKGEAVARWVHEIAHKRQRRRVRAGRHQGLQPAAARRADAADAGPVHPAAHQGLGGEDRLLRRLRLRDARVQPRDVGRAQERDRLPVRASGTTRRPGSSATAAHRGPARWRHLRLVMAELQVADVRAQVALSLFTDFENFTVFKPAPHQEKAVNGHARPGHRLGRRAEAAAGETNRKRRVEARDGQTGMQIGIDSFAAAYDEPAARSPRRTGCATWSSRSSTPIRSGWTSSASASTTARSSSTPPRRSSWPRRRRERAASVSRAPSPS